LHKELKEGQSTSPTKGQNENMPKVNFSNQASPNKNQQEKKAETDVEQHLIRRDTLKRDLDFAKPFS